MREERETERCGETDMRAPESGMGNREVEGDKYDNKRKSKSAWLDRTKEEGKRWKTTKEGRTERCTGEWEIKHEKIHK